MLDLARPFFKGQWPTCDQEIVLTFHIRGVLLLIMLILAGCMPVKKAQGPFPDGSGMASQNAENMPPRDAAVKEGAPEACGPVDDVDPLDVLPEGEELPDAESLSAEEQKILDTQISFHIGLDTEENEDVQRYFHYYTHVQRGTMTGWLKRAQLYLPHIRERFLAEGLPEDLIYLPFAESGFNPFAQSHAGACGVWQFMPRTAINYGLTVDKWVDERRDPYKSTEAAIAYLKKLYGDFGDWSLALAAYNAGEGAIGRALKKTGTEDFFSLCEASEDLKKETKLYVPKFLALVKVARNLEKLGFEPLNMDKRSAAPVMLKVKPETDLLALSQSVGMDWKSFRELNPSFRKQEAPPGRSVKVAVPGHLVAKAQDFLKRPVTPRQTRYASYRVKPGDTWWGISQKYNVSVAVLQQVNDVSRTKALKVGQALRIPGQGPASDSVADARKWASKRANYLVREGDTLWSIAKQFKTDPASLSQANGIQRSSVLRVGQKLYVPDAGSADVKVAKASADAVRTKLVNYKVQPGDSLWGIAKRFGVTPSDLLAWNNLAKNGHIRPGDRLKVYR
ncbi:membrane-bound lytic murein transglycosylase D [Desulfomicrobium apsheronum]|uniref:Membrane-bound lytic murein transglycosylase D n=2 Tax=Desulfomicrobium apsheronum TaxID=52560 RepID=A0A1I3XEZ4_9BACT|nr:membrane-bound lytic murein transglycosylase D [Desulfomicrobium apsheronum]